MIQHSKLAMIFLCRFIVSVCGFCWGIEISEPNLLVARLDLGSPLSNFMLKANTLESAFIITANFGILDIIGLCTVPEILLSVIEAVSIPMIYLLFAVVAKNFSMHSGSELFAVYFRITMRVKTVCVRIPVSKPNALSQTFVIFGINDGVLALCKRDQAVGWIRRLSNGVPWKRLTGHLLTSNENVFSAAILTGFAS